MKSKKLPSIIVLMILTVITILFLVSFSIYRVFTKESPTVVPAEIILDLDPKLDIQVIESIKNRL